MYFDEEEDEVDEGLEDRLVVDLLDEQHVFGRLAPVETLVGRIRDCATARGSSEHGVTQNRCKNSSYNT